MCLFEYLFSAILFQYNEPDFKKRFLSMLLYNEIGFSQTEVSF